MRTAFHWALLGTVTTSEVEEEMLQEEEVQPPPRPWAGEGDLPELSQQIRATRRITARRAQPLVARHTPNRRTKMTPERLAEVLRQYDDLEGTAVDRVRQLAVKLDRDESSVWRYLRDARKGAERGRKRSGK